MDAIAGVHILITVDTVVAQDQGIDYYLDHVRYAIKIIYGYVKLNQNANQLVVIGIAIIAHHLHSLN